MAEATKQGVALFLVGGPVRDWLAGESLRDLDFCMEGRTLRDAAALARDAAETGYDVTETERFGTARLSCGDACIDIAVTRQERYAKPGALPKVAVASLEADLSRRDFSVNAMAIPLTAAAKRGRSAVVDPFGGSADLRTRTLRTLHDRSFHDDPTRALRAARFAARGRYRLDPETLAGLRSALREGAFASVSGPRYRRELERLFRDGERGEKISRGLSSLGDWHVLPALEPGLAFPKRARLPVRRLERALTDPPWPTASSRPAALSAWMLWLGALGGDWPERVLARFDIRGDPARRILGFCADRKRTLRALSRARGRGAVDALLSDRDEATLLALYCSGEASERRRVGRYAAEDRHRTVPLSGDDLRELGFRGPAIGAVLARLRHLYLDGRWREPEVGLALGREIQRSGFPALRKSD